MKTIEFNNITFVIQGPVIETVTQRSINNIKELFPGSHIILSTWKGESLSDITVDQIIENNDPGATILSYGKDNQPKKANINRQILSTINGLRSVKTDYAVKIRSDNLLNSNRFIQTINKYKQRDPEHSIFENKIIYSNLFAKELTKGTKIPYFFSDFFHFGKTTDLVKLWDIPLFKDYSFQEKLSGKFQHKQYPMRCSHVEQDLWLAFLSKETNQEHKLHDEYGTQTHVLNSYSYMLNNIIMLDYQNIGIEVPQRLNQPNKFPYEFYQHLRWKWLYEKHFKLKSTVPVSFKSKWYIGYIYKFLRHGIRYKIKNKIKNL